MIKKIVEVKVYQNGKESHEFITVTSNRDNEFLVDILIGGVTKTVRGVAIIVAVENAINSEC